jgi:LAO/AO transport system kinase
MAGAGHHGVAAMEQHADDAEGDVEEDDESWEPPVVETVAKTGEGVETFLDTLEDHRAWLETTGELDAKLRTRYAEEIRALLREDTADLLQEELDARGGIDALVEDVVAKETDPYTVADEIVEPLADCVADRRD